MVIDELTAVIQELGAARAVEFEIVEKAALRFFDVCSSLIEGEGEAAELAVDLAGGGDVLW